MPALRNAVTDTVWMSMSAVAMGMDYKWRSAPARRRQKPCLDVPAVDIEPEGLATGADSSAGLAPPTDGHEET